MSSLTRRSPFASWLGWCVACLAFAAMWNYIFTSWPRSAVGLIDLYPPWYGSRELLLHGRDPYSSEVTRDIQLWQRGRPARAQEDQGRFAYPIFVAFVLSPSVTFTFSTVRRIAFWVLLGCVAGSVLASLKVAHWRLSTPNRILLTLFSLGSLPVLFGLRLEQLGLLSGSLLITGLACVIADHLVLAGVLLGLANIKPQLAGLPAVWLLLWSFGNWPRRQRLFWSFLVTMLTLVLGGELLVRNWIEEFVAAMTAYSGYNDSRSILMLLFSRLGGIAISILAVIALMVWCADMRRSSADSIDFAFCSALVLSLTLTVIPTLAAHGQVLLLPAVFLLITSRKAISDAGVWPRRTFSVTCVLLAWPYVLAGGFSLVALLYGPTVARRFWLWPISAAPLLPLAVTISLIAGKAAVLASGRPRTPLLLPVGTAAG